MVVVHVCALACPGSMCRLMSCQVCYSQGPLGSHNNSNTVEPDLTWPNVHSHNTYLCSSTMQMTRVQMRQEADQQRIVMWYPMSISSQTDSSSPPRAATVAAAVTSRHGKKRRSMRVWPPSRPLTRSQTVANDAEDKETAATLVPFASAQPHVIYNGFFYSQAD